MAPIHHCLNQTIRIIIAREVNRVLVLELLIIVMKAVENIIITVAYQGLVCSFAPPSTQSKVLC